MMFLWSTKLPFIYEHYIFTSTNTKQRKDQPSGDPKN